MVKAISESEFDEAVKEGLSVVDFSATWCGPCQMLKPVLEDASGEFDGKVKFFAVDVDEAEDLSRKLGVMAVPSIFVFKDGAQVAMTTGFQPKDALVSWVNGAIA